MVKTLALICGAVGLMLIAFGTYDPHVHHAHQGIGYGIAGTAIAMIILWIKGEN